jgi:hypothetical protein
MRWPAFLILLGPGLVACASNTAAPGPAYTSCFDNESLCDAGHDGATVNDGSACAAAFGDCFSGTCGLVAPASAQDCLGVVCCLNLS